MDGWDRETPATSRSANGDGFTLIELLIVIVILGVLATVVVFAVRGISDEGQEAACGSELRTISTAAEAYRANRGAYPDEATMVSVGVLRSDSSLYDVAAPGDGTYSIAPAAGSPCTGSVSGGSASAVPPPPPPVTPTSITFGVLPAWQYGATGADEIVVLGRTEGEADFIAMITAAPPTSRRITFINLDLVTTTGWVDYILNRSRTNGVTDVAIYLDDDTVAIPGHPNVDAYLSTAVIPDPYHYVDASGPTLESLVLMIG